jgi:hypothetical protein
MNKSIVGLGVLAITAAVGAPYAGAQYAGGSIPFVAPTPGAGPSPVAAPVVQGASLGFSVPAVQTPSDSLFIKDFIHMPKVMPNPVSPSAIGVKEIDEDITSMEVDNPSEFVLFNGDKHSHFEKQSETAIKLESGAVLVSVRPPSKLATVDTPHGLIAIRGEGDVLVSFVADVLRVENISARNDSCRIKFEDDILDEEKAVALAPSYELVVSDDKLLTGEIRPADGVHRRMYYVFHNGKVAVNEYKIDTLLKEHPLIAHVIENKTDKETRVLKDMMKMASVMNYVHGAGGYAPAEGTGIAATPGAITE